MQDSSRVAGTIISCSSSSSISLSYFHLISTFSLCSFSAFFFFQLSSIVLFYSSNCIVAFLDCDRNFLDTVYAAQRFAAEKLRPSTHCIHWLKTDLQNKSHLDAFDLNFNPTFHDKRAAVARSRFRGRTLVTIHKAYPTIILKLPAKLRVPAFVF